MVRRAPALLTAGTAALALCASPAPAASVRFDGTPSVRFNGHWVVAVMRLSATPQKLTRTELFAAPSLTAGEHIGRAYGGNPPVQIARPDRHCYAAEVARPEPRHALQDGARWELGVRHGWVRTAALER